MTTTQYIVPELMQHRALMLGDQGAQWLASLPGLISDIEGSWDLRLQQQLSGGTEALVFLATQGDDSAVLKVGIPGSLKGEALTLQHADGQGYAKLLAHDERRGAILLERLGGRLADSPLSVYQQIEIICRTLGTAWRTIADPTGLTTGADKAHLQASFIESNWDTLNPPCTPAVRDLALEYAAARALAYDPATSVLAHGDAHIWNTLQQTADNKSYKFVDPDGVYAEPAFDLGISLREWRAELLAGDTLANGQERCAQLAQLTGVDSEAIWQWGFIEQVSCGLLDLQLGDSRAVGEHLKIATAWLP